MIYEPLWYEAGIDFLFFGHVHACASAAARAPLAASRPRPRRRPLPLLLVADWRWRALPFFADERTLPMFNYTGAALAPGRR